MEESKKRLLIMLAIVGVMLGVSSFVYWQKTSTAVNSSAGFAPPAAPGGEPVVIYISGAVKQPGVFKVPAGARVVDAINAAGGLAPGADVAKVNMAQKTSDGMHINIPSNIAPAGSNQAGRETKTQAAGKININTADKAELDKLPGVGPALADRIIEYRNANGGFRDLSELIKVPGIGESKYNQIKDRITI